MPSQYIWIELLDGRRLSARLWLPEDNQQPAPAILEYLPYRQRDGTSERDDGNYPIFAAAGYAGVRVDMAGNGDSDGLMTDEYLEDELATGQEIIEWIAAQPWCSGAVGMIGISWGGFNGLQIAMRDVPALRAIVTVCSTHDRYRQETHYIGGCVLNDNFNWGAQMTALSTRPPDPQMRSDWREMWLERIQKLPFLAADWLRHQRHSAHWKHGSVCEDWSAIQCAVLTVGGWADSYSDTPAVLLENLSAPVKALVGPWEHRYSHIAKIAPQADFHNEVIQWFDCWLKGENNNAKQMPAYRAYMQEYTPPSPKLKPMRGRWVSEPSMPLATPPLLLYMAPSALCEAPLQQEAEHTFTSAQDVGMATGNYCPGMRVDDELPDDQRIDDEKSLCFDSKILDAAVDILGAPVVEVEFSVDQPQAMLAMRLCDVAPDGSSQRVSYMVFNLTHRNGHERPVDLQPGQRYRLSIPLRHCAHRFVAGNRIRLALSTSYWPLVWPSPLTTAMTLHLKNCHLQLPHRQSPTTEREHTIPATPPPVTEKSTYQQLRAATNKNEVLTRADGTREIILSDDLGEAQNPHHAMEIGATVQQKFSIHPDNPLSAIAETKWEYTYRRDHWNTRIVSQNKMTCDAYSFILFREVIAYEGEDEILKKTWHEIIARDCC